MGNLRWCVEYESSRGERCRKKKKKKTRERKKYAEFFERMFSVFSIVFLKV